MKTCLLFFWGVFLCATHALSQSPTITSFTPPGGPVGTTVTISGTNFSATPANNIVFFGATRASVSAATTTQLQVSVPAGATYQPISVLVGGLIAYSANPFIVAFDGNGVDANSFAPKIDFTPGVGTISVYAGDIDGDGKPDMIVPNSDDISVSVFRNTTSTPGTLTFAPRVDFIPGGAPSYVSVGDIDGDGKLDLAITCASNIISVLRNTSSPGSLSFAPKQDFSSGGILRAITMGDVSGDGKTDLVFANANNVGVLRNTGTPGTISFAAKVDYAVGTGSAPASVAVGDVDGDGKPEMITSNPGNATLSVFRNTTTAGVMSFAARVDFSAGDSPIAVALGDLDGDNKSDVVASNFASATISVFRNTSTVGSILLDPKVDFALAGSPYSVAIADIDGDAKVDLAAVSASTNSVSVFRNTSSVGALALGTRVDFTTGSSPRILGIADLDLNGKPDLLVANSTSGTISFLANRIKGNQTITFGALPSKTFGDASFNLTATASSALALSYSSSNTAVATVAGNMVTIIGAGSTTLTASQDGNGDFNAASSVQQILTVNKANQTITFTALAARTFGDSTFTISATSSSTLPVSFISGNTAVATVSGSTVTIVGAGTTSITAGQSGNSNFNPAAGVPQTLTVNKANQTITFAPLVTRGVGDAPFVLTATASSGLPVSYTSSNPAVASVSDSTVTVVAFGTTTITASQSGNANFNPASNVQQTQVVKLNQAISFPAISDKTLGDAAFTISATSTSALPVSFSTTSAKITLTGTQVTLVSPGRATITANQEGDVTYNNAPSVNQSFCIKPTKPTITFSGANTSSATLTSSAVAGNQWYLNGVLITGETNQTITIAQAGVYTVQVQVDDCLSAPSDDVPVIITALEQNAIEKISIYPNPVSEELVVNLNGFDVDKPVNVAVVDALGRVLTQSIAYGGAEVRLRVSGYQAGQYLVLAHQGNRKIVRSFIKSR